MEGEKLGDELWEGPGLDVGPGGHVLASSRVNYGDVGPLRYLAEKSISTQTREIEKKSTYLLVFLKVCLKMSWL